VAAVVLPTKIIARSRPHQLLSTETHLPNNLPFRTHTHLPPPSCHPLSPSQRCRLSLDRWKSSKIKSGDRAGERKLDMHGDMAPHAAEEYRVRPPTHTRPHPHPPLFLLHLTHAHKTHGTWLLRSRVSISLGRRTHPSLLDIPDPPPPSPSLLLSLSWFLPLTWLTVPLHVHLTLCSSWVWVHWNALWVRVKVRVRVRVHWNALSLSLSPTFTLTITRCSGKPCDTHRWLGHQRRQREGGPRNSSSLRCVRSNIVGGGEDKSEDGGEREKRERRGERGE
jgi:hypothetical protein